MERMHQFIAAFQVFAKYNPKANTGAEHDEFYVYGKGLSPDQMRDEDKKQLDELRWDWNEDMNCWRRFT